jgi:arylsulfatase
MSDIPTPGRADQPNIILIVTDQERYDTIGALGFDWMQTPNLDRLMNEGVSFDRCYCTAPSCAPSRASFFCADWPHRIGVLRNGHHWQKPSWIETFQDAGYHTINLGKMHTQPVDDHCGFDQRFIVENKDRPTWAAVGGYFYDEWQRYLFQNGVKFPERNWYKAEHPDWAEGCGAYPWPLEEKYHPDQYVGDLADWFIRQWPSGGPMFMEIGFPGPHPPYDPPQRYLDMYEGVDIPIPEVDRAELDGQPLPHASYRREMMTNNHDSVKWHDQPTAEQLRRLRKHYAANMTLIDEQVGRIVQALEDTGMLDNTVIVFTSDHGDNLGDHGHIQKWTFYEEILRVPAIAWAPGRLPAGQRYDGMIEQFDLAAMMLEFAGLDLPDDSPAQSAAGLVDGTWKGRDAVFAEHGPDALMYEIDYMHMVRTDRWKLVRYKERDYGELYDLASDAGETRNLWDDPACADIKLEMLNRLLDIQSPHTVQSKRSA